MCPASSTAQIAGSIILLLIGFVFHFLGEDSSPLMLSAILLYPWSSLQRFNQWVVARIKSTFGVDTSALRVLQAEVVTLGFTLMQIGEWALAIGCWIVLGVVGLAKGLGWGKSEDADGSVLGTFSSATGALLLCIFLVTITALRKPDSEPWSNLLKLRHNDDEAVSVLPYDLTGQRRKTFLKLLAPAPDETDTLRIGCLAGSDSACVAAGQFLLLLSEAGWTIDSGQVFPLGSKIPTAGVSLASRPQQPIPLGLPPHLGSWQPEDRSQTKIGKVFTQMGVPINSAGAPDLPLGTIGIYFGPDPGPQILRLYMLLSECKPDSESCDILAETTRNHGTFLTTGNARQIVHADHPKCVAFNLEASEKNFTVTQSDLPRTVKLGRCLDHPCSITILQFTNDAIVVDSRGTTIWEEENKRMGSVPIRWKLLGEDP